MQAIITRYYGPTDHKGTRIVASCKGGRVTLPYNYELDETLNHFDAATALCKKMGWDYSLAPGTLASGDYCWVMLPSNKILG